MASGTLQKRTLSDVWINTHISQRRLAIVFLVLFLVSLIPLFTIALYNYPADDDFSHTHTSVVAWVSTHSLSAVLRSAAETVADVYQTWNGDFTQFIITVSTPMIFGLQYYFLSNWLVLIFICLSMGYGLKGLLVHLLHAPRTTFYLVYVIVTGVMLQFMPSIAEGVYWHAATPYVITWCFIPVMAGLLIRLSAPQSVFRRSLRVALLILFAVLSGGSTYPVVVSTFVLLSFITGCALFSKWKNRGYVVLMFTAFLAGLAVSLLAPGNALRQDVLGDTSSVMNTLVTSVLESCDLVGQWFSLILLAALLLLIPILWKPLRESSFSFRHPVLVAVMLFGVFASSLSPGIYTRFGYDSNRYINPVYFSFLLFAFGSVLYAQGAFIRLLERRCQEPAARGWLEATQTIGQRFSAAYLTLCLVMLLFGCFGNTIMNTSSVSAAKSLVTGEAAQFREDMAERQAYILATDSDVVAVQRLTAKPYVFKDEKLPFQGIYGAVRYMKWYFEMYETPNAP